jgi:hypothetical protein
MRNATRSKTVLTEIGPVKIDVDDEFVVSLALSLVEAQNPFG